MDAYTSLRNGRIDLARAVPLTKPFSLLFEPACMCNFRCAYCYYSEPDAALHLSKGRMSFDDFCKIVADLEAWEGDKIKVVRFIGFGEPLLNKQTPDMIRYIKQKDIAERVEMTTNGSLLASDVATRLVAAQLDYIRVSVYAATQQKHREITQSSIRVETIRGNVAALREIRDKRGASKPFIYAKMIEHSDVGENEKFIEMYRDIADEVALEPQHNWLDTPFAAKGGRIACPQPFKMMSVRYNGDVILCDPDWQNNTLVGNALREGVRHVWNGENVKKFWTLQLQGRRRENKSCATCSFIDNPAYVLDDIDSIVARAARNGGNE